MMAVTKLRLLRDWRRYRSSRAAALCLLVMAATLSAPPARGQDLLSPAPSTNMGLPPQYQDVGFKPPLNGQLPLDDQFRDENGQTVHLGDYFHGKPVILALVYYQCPLLCNQTLQGLVGSLKMLTFNAGEDFQVVVVSFDPRETSAMALAKKQDVLSHYRRSSEEQGWHFLTGDQAEIHRLTDAAGFRFVWDAESQMWAHASGILAVTPEGRISRYFYGIEFSPRDVRWGLIEASHNRIGTPVDQVLLFCYHYDPRTGKYGALIVRMIRVGGILTLLGLGLLIYLCVRRTRQMHQLRAGGVQ
jgi:protein SCO1/2